MRATLAPSPGTCVPEAAAVLRDARRARTGRRISEPALLVA